MYENRVGVRKKEGLGQDREGRRERATRKPPAARCCGEIWRGVGDGNERVGAHRKEKRKWQGVQEGVRRLQEEVGDGWGGTSHHVPRHQVRPSASRSTGPLWTARASLPPAYLYLPARRSGPSRAAAAGEASAAPRRILRPPPPCPEITLSPPPPYKEQNGKEKRIRKKKKNVRSKR